MNWNEKISHLSDQQALAILSSLSAVFCDESTPEIEADQIALLHTVMEEHGHSQASAIIELPDQQAGEAARGLLLTMAEIPEMKDTLSQHLEKPPQQEQAAVLLPLDAAVVYTACVVALQVAGHLSAKMNSLGKWIVEYDPTREAPLDKVISGVANTLFGVSNAILNRLKGHEKPTKD